MAEKLLLIDDSIDSQKLVTRTLASRCQVQCAGSGKSALEIIARERFDLILLDVNLPDADGFSLFGSIRDSARNAETPVIFLTGRSELTDKVFGFSLGADDYVVKPFEPLELRARVDAKLNRLRESKVSTELIRKGPFRIDLPSQRAFVEEREVALTPLEFKLLTHLLRHEDHVITRGQLLDSVWGGDTHVVDRVIDKHVSTLRQKLGACARFIETIPGSGYRFAAK